MKKRLLMTAGLTAILGVSCINFTTTGVNDQDVGPAPTEFSADPKGAYAGAHYAKDTIIPNSLTIHYQNDDANGDYSKFCFYLWTVSMDGQEYETTGIDEYGMYITVNPQDFGVHDTFMFIIKKPGTWQGQSDDTEIPYAQFPADADGKLEVWTMPGEGGSIEVYKTKKETEGGKITYAKFDDWKTLHVETTMQVRSFEVYAFNSAYYNLHESKRDAIAPNHLVATGNPWEACFDIKFPFYTPASLVYKIAVRFTDDRIKSKVVSMEPLYNTERFEEFYTYDGKDLGVKYTKEKTTFKLWAPMCANVKLRIYENGTPAFIDILEGSVRYDAYRMNLLEGGVWSCEVPGDLNGMYYTFAVDNAGGFAEVCDPYAKATGINGIRGMILDFDTTDPENWDEVPEVWDGNGAFDIKASNELSIYEIHVRDLTMDDTWGGKEKAGTYKAFAEKGTTYSKNGKTVTTGFDHIQELGVNAVQILPFFDGSNNEVDDNLQDNKVGGKFNWGYNPLNYNCIEGMYSTDPFHGEVRIKEFKELVAALALSDNHIRVIMDVVYNHVASVASSNFTKIMPKYFFRVTEDGFYHNGAGCGNEVRTESTMMRKFIVDSVTWWATEYKIKGFRFDLMGLIDTDTMRAVKDAVYAVDADNVCYGEGWSLGYNGEGHGTDTGAYYSELYPTPDSPGILGGFSDGFRDAIRGYNDGGWGSNDPLPARGGFMNKGQNDGNRHNVAQGVKGIHEGKGANSLQTVNYASAHDNWTLYDQLHYSLSPAIDHSVEPAFKDVAEALLAVQSVVTYSAGMAFYHAGEEVYRTKIDTEEVQPGELVYTANMYGVPISHNSYASSDETNSLKYDRKISVNYLGKDIDTTDYFAKYCEMINSRKDYLGKIQYPNNCNESFAKTYNSKGNANGFAVQIKNEGVEYWVCVSSNYSANIDISSGSKKVIYNTHGENNGYSFNGSTISLSPRQVVVFIAE